MFNIDTGGAQYEAKSAVADDTQNIRFTTRARAETFVRQTIAAIESLEFTQEVDSYLRAENLAMDGLFLFDPALAEQIQQAAEEHKIILKSGGVEAAMIGSARNSAINQTRTKENTMFAIDTGDTGGSQGPWVSWTSNGSAMKGFAPMKWVLRGKDQQDQKFENVIPAFEQGCVMDLDTLKLGWEKDGAKGVAPERRWNPSISQATPRPDDSKKPSGAYAWSRALSVRLAIGGGDTATWEQGSFAAYRAFEKLAPQIQSSFPNNGTLPLIKQTGVEQVSLSSGSANIPILEIVQWVPRPECLKADAMQIATGDAPDQAAAPTPAPAAPAAQPAPAPAATVPADVSF